MQQDLLACPLCRGALLGDDPLRCSSCRAEYPLVEGIPDFTPRPPPDPDVLRRWELWEQLQANGDVIYRADPPGNLSVDGHHQAALMGSFSRLEGVVLDVGCGPQRRPLYAAGFGGLLVGIDPLRGERERDLDFAVGIGEYLPFADRVFDRVLFATSLDHAMSPTRAIKEATRVTRSGGQVIVWMGVPSTPVPMPDNQRVRLAAKLLLTRQWGEFRDRVAHVRAIRRAAASSAHGETYATPAGLITVAVPEGAVDAFHIDHPTVEQTIAWLTAAGLEISEVDRSNEEMVLIRALRP